MPALAHPTDQAGPPAATRPAQAGPPTSPADKPSLPQPGPAAGPVEQGDPLTEQVVRLAVEELLHRAGPPDQLREQAAEILAQHAGPAVPGAGWGWVRRQVARRLFGWGTPPAGPVEGQADKPAAGTNEPGQAGVSGRRPGLLDETYAMVVLAAPLVVAGWFQAHAVHTLLGGLPWALAIGFTAAWEGAAGYCARLYLRALLRGDSTIVLRLAMIVYAAASAGLLWLELHVEGKPPWLAAGVGGLTASGIFLWSRRARDRRRDDLHRMGRVDRQVVKFSLASWVACPIETPFALRYAIKHRIEAPQAAIEAYWAHRDRARAARRHRRMLRALGKARKAARDRAHAQARPNQRPGTRPGRPKSRRRTRPAARSRPAGRIPRRSRWTGPGGGSGQATGAGAAGSRQADRDALVLRRKFRGRIPGRNEIVRRMDWGNAKASNARDALGRLLAAEADQPALTTEETKQ